ncbi:MAG: phosphotransferase [Actinomycetota bacterium]|nr:phosphotransferase [Actinomycetota bacterium]
MNIDLEQIRARLPEQRWFGGKGRVVASVSLVDSGIIEDGPPALVIAIVEVAYGDGGTDLYHLPLLVEPDGSSRDAFEDADRLKVLGELMCHGSSIKGSSGVFQFGGPSLDPSHPPGALSVRVLGAEQSNTSLVLDEEVIVKTFRRVAVGRNPDLELTRLLSTEGFMNIPAHAGEVTYEGEDDTEENRIDLGLAQQFISDAKEGWSETLEWMRTLYDAVDPADVNEDIRFLIEERARDQLKTVEDLGEATAALHVTLGREQVDPDLAPEAVVSFDLDEWAAAATASLAALADAELVELRPLVAGIEARIAKVTEVESPGKKIRVHGDYHLGQVIRSSRGWLILDFEGEPARTLDERRAKQSPLKDVAGMVRSFSYAATASLFERAGEDAAEWQRLEPWALGWEELARDRFLHGYLTRSHEGDFLPGDRASLLAVLDFFEIDKALYELAYELSHRPTWVHIPLRGIRQVIERGEGG